MTIYALYKGEEFIDVGTAEEIAERQGMKPETITYFAHAKRVKLRDERTKDCLIAVVVEKASKMSNGRKEYMKEYMREYRIKKKRLKEE